MSPDPAVASPDPAPDARPAPADPLAAAAGLPEAARRQHLCDAAWAGLRRAEEDGAAPAGLPRLVSAAADALRGAGELQAGAGLCARAAALLGGSLHYTAGKALCHAGQLPEAEAALRRYLRESVDRPAAADDDPEASPPSARHLLGRVAMLDGQLRLAERWLKEAISQADPADAVPVACDLVRVWLRGRRLDRAVAALGDLCGAPSADDAHERERLLLGAEVAMMLGDLQGAVPLCRAALDPSGRDDRAAALLGTLHLRQLPREGQEALALLPLLPGRRFDTLAVRLLLLRLRGDDAPDGGAATRSASAALLSSLPPLVQRRVPILTDEGPGRSAL